MPVLGTKAVLFGCIMGNARDQIKKIGRKHQEWVKEWQEWMAQVWTKWVIDISSRGPYLDNTILLYFCQGLQNDNKNSYLAPGLFPPPILYHCVGCTPPQCLKRHQPSLACLCIINNDHQVEPRAQQCFGSLKPKYSP